ncbi:hypothetical protein RJ639_040021 [Escallonia herrerae]|uniref:Glutaredoxin domain-containing protein n=1 Tax=Escallonia herrerae TaxID=1293975 RepID=A0AA89B817_9ASTE|nr:hypothetical protein RJ639_040021 [Escallonia herrerae]
MEEWRQALTQAASIEEGLRQTGNLDEFLSKIVEEFGKGLGIPCDSRPLVKPQYPSVRYVLDSRAGTVIHNFLRSLTPRRGTGPSTLWNISFQPAWLPENIPTQPQQPLPIKAPLAQLIEELDINDASASHVQGKFGGSFRKSTVSSASTQHIKPPVHPKTDLLSGYPYKCPPGGEDKVVLYTSLGAIRPISSNCREVIAILHEHRVTNFEHRDAWKDINFKKELKNLVGSLSYPRLFVKGRHIGGVNEVKDLDEKDSGGIPEEEPDVENEQTLADDGDMPDDEDAEKDEQTLPPMVLKPQVKRSMREHRPSTTYPSS